MNRDQFKDVISAELIKLGYKPVLFYNKDLLNASNVNVDSLKSFEDILIASKNIHEKSSGFQRNSFRKNVKESLLIS
jgi:maltose-binding protein MalE